MQKCSYCGAELPENSRFCGNCGGVQDTTATDAATTRSNTPQPYWTPEGGTLPASQPPSMYPPASTYPAPGSQPSWPSEISSPGTPPPPPPTEKDDERRGIPPWPSMYGTGLGADALMSGGQPYGGAPVVQGTPQIGSVPNVAGSATPYTNTPVGHLAQGPAYQAPASSYPQAGQQSTYYPPQQQGTPEQHPIHEQQGHHAHHARHLHHTATATKVAGGSAVKTVIIVVTIVVVVAAGGVAAAAYFLSRPQPLISITSNYKVGNALAGASGTILHISGQKFSGNSAIAFLLDGNAAPGNPSARSDANGNFSTDMKITDAWSVGTHTLTARDASNYNTKNSVGVTVVQPGVANTPGPHGAPPDDATFNINLSAKGTYNSGNQPFTSNETLHVTGHPDPAGGIACEDGDNGQQISTSSETLDTHLAFTENYSFTCQGSYKSGKVSYTETLATDVITYTSSGVSCTLTSPQMSQQVTGTFTSQNTFTGTFIYGHTPQSDFHCTQPNWYFFYTGGQGTWTGTVGG